MTLRKQEKEATNPEQQHQALSLLHASCSAGPIHLEIRNPENGKMM